ncbi:MAG TPA: RdgB/HAM1 family non-canonical purine NTP pyrophosphatase [Candidatus Omnitrophota bacterium]|nr:RdgB/HAM1 family non-canonical purine NTP pyrophosphatase [Candidatus Omnitrophota bacterium]HPS37730.1 RdgB/HAM1 family non-canonical purine NTP pyrophosphatase [Candidatus Omnitrophota bacterium]
MSEEPVRLLLATSNLKKLKELQDLVVGLPVRCLSLKDFPQVSSVEETGRTFEENAKIKALGYAEQTGMLTIGEDSGICCEALGGAPGVFSARFSEYRTDESNNEKLLASLKDVPDEKRTAYYESAIALAEPDRLVGVVRGQVHGLITRELQGAGGFGYDPLFFYPPYQKTFGEVPPVMKHVVSHRGKAFSKLRKLLEAYLAKRS